MVPQYTIYFSLAVSIAMHFNRGGDEIKGFFRT